MLNVVYLINNFKNNVLFLLKILKSTKMDIYNFLFNLNLAKNISLRY